MPFHIGKSSVNPLDGLTLFELNETVLASAFRTIIPAVAGKRARLHRLQFVISAQPGNIEIRYDTGNLLYYDRAEYVGYVLMDCIDAPLVNAVANDQLKWRCTGETICANIMAWYDYIGA